MPARHYGFTGAWGTRMNWRVGALIAGLIVGGCSVDVNGFVGSEKFTGTVSQGLGTGTMNVKGDTGTKCLGHYSARGMASGDGFLQCDDGRQALIRYENTSLGVGYGYGTTNTGDLVRFYFGISAEAAAQRIGEMPGKAAAASGGARGSAKGSTGTGFFITQQGHILTNAHVVDNCTSVVIQQQGVGASPAPIVAVDKQNDLALLRAETHPTAIAALRGNRPVRPGENVVAYGFPLNGLVSSGGVLTTGTVSALAGVRDDTRYFQISAPLQPGNSGGPLLDATGTVIGVNSASLGNRAARAIGTTPQNVNFAIKSDVVRTFLSTQGIVPETGGAKELGVPDIGERARAFTVLVECKG
jgi:S1-C subfamily serine protease